MTIQIFISFIIGVMLVLVIMAIYNIGKSDGINEERKRHIK